MPGPVVRRQSFPSWVFFRHKCAYPPPSCTQAAPTSTTPTTPSNSTAPTATSTATSTTSVLFPKRRTGVAGSVASTRAVLEREESHLSASFSSVFTRGQVCRSSVPSSSRVPSINSCRCGCSTFTTHYFVPHVSSPLSACFVAFGIRSTVSSSLFSPASSNVQSPYHQHRLFSSRSSASRSVRKSKRPVTPSPVNEADEANEEEIRVEDIAIPPKKDKTLQRSSASAWRVQGSSFDEDDGPAPPGETPVKRGKLWSPRSNDDTTSAWRFPLPFRAPQQQQQSSSSPSSSSSSDASAASQQQQPARDGSESPAAAQGDIPVSPPPNRTMPHRVVNLWSIPGIDECNAVPSQKATATNGTGAAGANGKSTAVGGKGSDQNVAAADSVSAKPSATATPPPLAMPTSRLKTSSTNVIEVRDLSDLARMPIDAELNCNPQLLMVSALAGSKRNKTKGIAAPPAKKTDDRSVSERQPHAAAAAAAAATNVPPSSSPSPSAPPQPSSTDSETGFAPELQASTDTANSAKVVAEMKARLKEMSRLEKLAEAKAPASSETSADESGAAEHGTRTAENDAAAKKASNAKKKSSTTLDTLLMMDAHEEEQTMKALGLEEEAKKPAPSSSQKSSRADAETSETSEKVEASKSEEKESNADMAEAAHDYIVEENKRETMWSDACTAFHNTTAAASTSARTSSSPTASGGEKEKDESAPEKTVPAAQSAASDSTATATTTTTAGPATPSTTTSTASNSSAPAANATELVHSGMPNGAMLPRSFIEYRKQRNVTLKKYLIQVLGSDFLKAGMQNDGVHTSFSIVSSQAVKQATGLTWVPTKLLVSCIGSPDYSWDWVDISAHPTATLDEYRDSLTRILMDLGTHDTLVNDAMEPMLLPQATVLRGCHCLLVRYAVENISSQMDSFQELTNRFTVFISEKRIVTVHRTHCAFIEELKKDWPNVCEKQQSNTRTFLLHFFVKEAVGTFSNALTKSIVEFDRYEASLFSPKKHRSTLAREIYHIKRRASVYARTLNLIGDSYTHICSTLSVSPTDVNYQDVQQDVAHVKSLSEELNANADSVLQLLFQLSSYQLNELMRVLTMFSAFFIPLSFIASVFGMNFTGLPLISNDNGHWYCVLLMGIVGASLGMWFKAKKFF